MNDSPITAAQAQNHLWEYLRQEVKEASDNVDEAQRILDEKTAKQRCPHNNPSVTQTASSIIRILCPDCGARSYAAPVDFTIPATPGEMRS